MPRKCGVQTVCYVCGYHAAIGSKDRWQTPRALSCIGHKSAVGIEQETISHEITSCSCHACVQKCAVLKPQCVRNVLTKATVCMKCADPRPKATVCAKCADPRPTATVCTKNVLTLGLKPQCVRKMC